MSLWTFNTLAALLNCAKVVEDFAIDGVAIDSRDLQIGDLFVALKSVRDGHEFVPDAVAAGAVAVLVDHPLPACTVPQLVVENTEEALCQIGAVARRRNTSAKRFAVTGSVGKTSTKELLAVALGAGAHKSEKSYNNQWGVPLTLARFPEQAPFGVFEVGMNHVGEIAPLAEQIRPDVALITNIGLAHIGNMGSAEAIAQEKLDVAQGLAENGTLVLPLVAQKQFDQLMPKVKMMTFAHEDAANSADAVLHSAEIQPEGGMVCMATICGEKVVFDLQLNGAHHAVNAVAALLAAKVAGVDVQAAAHRLHDLEPMTGRGEIRRAAGVTIVDESYNANPVSMRAALRSFVDMPTTGKKWAIVGDMLELGAQSAAMHAALAPDCKGLDGIYCVGADMQALFDALPARMEKYHVRGADILNYTEISQRLSAGDSVLVKGSKGTIYIYNVASKLASALGEQK